jgi:hypothetical protein
MTAATGNRGNPGGFAAARRHQGIGAIERRLFQRMQALEDAVAYRLTRVAAPCPDCQPAPGPRCDDHGRDLGLIGEYQRTIRETAGYLQRIHAASLRTGHRPVPQRVASRNGTDATSRSPLFHDRG